MAEGRYVTRDELNGSLLRLETQVAEIRNETGEIYKVLREQNSCFITLLDREIDKRETCAHEHDVDMKVLAKSINDHAQDETKDKVSFSRKLFFVALGALSTLGISVIMFILGYVIRR